MNAIEQARFNPLHERMLQALKLQGKRPKTIDAYSRAVRRVAGLYSRCPDTLDAADLKTYFASLLETHSWSTIKPDCNGLQFFYKHVLGKQWEWVDIVKPPQERPLPDVLSQEETFRLIDTVRCDMGLPRICLSTTSICARSRSSSVMHARRPPPAIRS